MVKGITKKLTPYLGRERDLPKTFPAVWEGTRKPKKNSSCCSGMGIQGVPVGKYTVTGIPANADLQKVANGANAIHNFFLTEPIFANINTTKQMEYMFISADFRIFLGHL